MERKIITRATAYEQSLPRYFTGKACRAGHLAERYTSGGGCLECMAVSQKNQHAKNVMLRRRHNALKAKDDTSYVLSIPHDWCETFSQLQDIALHAAPHQVARVHDFINALHKETRNPFVAPTKPMQPSRTIDRADILRVVKWNGTTVTNIPELDITDTDGVSPVLIRIGLEQYEGELVMQCLRGALAVVPPYDAPL